MPQANLASLNTCLCVRISQDDDDGGESKFMSSSTKTTITRRTRAAEKETDNAGATKWIVIPGRGRFIAAASAGRRRLERIRSAKKWGMKALYLFC